jgi:hypothetical protein
MGAVSAEKKQYDQLTVEYFESSNSSEPSWSAYSVRRRGRFCDVVAINSDSIAVIEVKSPKEKSCDSSYNDAVHMCKELMPPILAPLSPSKTFMSQETGQQAFSARSRLRGPFQVFC